MPGPTPREVIVWDTELLEEAKEERLNLMDDDQEVPQDLLDEIARLQEEIRVAGCKIVEMMTWE